MKNLFHGELVRLTAADAERDAQTMAAWSRDSEYGRMLDSDPALPKSVKSTQDNITRWLETDRPDGLGFVIRTLADDRLIGFVGLNGIRWKDGDAFVGIGIGEREYWGNGYGTDAMRVLLRYAFTELNLHRVSLNVFEYNPRAIRSYEKAGFIVEGRERLVLWRDGRRYDVIGMGILRPEWEQLKDD
jgi:RimJ/RimL family protein N-acetyltransferase